MHQNKDGSSLKNGCRLLLFVLLVVDEAYYIKNPKARRSINVKNLSAHAERLLFMTGTALENTVDEKIMSTLESKQAIFDAFADKSVAAMESLDLDERTFGNIIEEEIDRINAKNGKQ